MKDSDYIKLGLGAVALYFVWDWYSNPNSTLNSATSGIANWWVNLTSGTAPAAQGIVYMPDGTQVPASEFQGNVPSGGADPTFTYGGQTYNLTSNGDGTYSAS